MEVQVSFDNTASSQVIYLDPGTEVRVYGSLDGFAPVDMTFVVPEASSFSDAEPHVVEVVLTEVFRYTFADRNALCAAFVNSAGLSVSDSRDGSYEPVSWDPAAEAIICSRPLTGSEIWLRNAEGQLCVVQNAEGAFTLTMIQVPVVLNLSDVSTGQLTVSYVGV